MPPNSVVAYLNQRLPAVHPGAHLSGRARLLCRGGNGSGWVGALRAVPRQAPMLEAATGAVFGWSAKRLAVSGSGRQSVPEILDAHAWAGEDVIFSDRFACTAHALHHIGPGADTIEGALRDGAPPSLAATRPGAQPVETP